MFVEDPTSQEGVGEIVIQGDTEDPGGKVK